MQAPLVADLLKAPADAPAPRPLSAMAVNRCSFRAPQILQGAHQDTPQIPQRQARMHIFEPPNSRPSFDEYLGEVWGTSRLVDEIGIIK